MELPLYQFNSSTIASPKLQPLHHHSNPITPPQPPPTSLGHHPNHSKFSITISQPSLSRHHHKHHLTFCPYHHHDHLTNFHTTPLQLATCIYCCPHLIYSHFYCGYLKNCFHHRSNYMLILTSSNIITSQSP